MSKSKYAVLTLQIIGVIFLSGYAASAQLMPGMIDMRPSMNATMTNSINSARTRAMSGGSGGNTAGDRQRAVGSGIIRSGKSNTTFTPKIAVTREFAKSISWGSSDAPKTLDAQVAYINDLTAKFNRIMVENKLTPNDAVDGMMLAYAIAVTIEQGKRPSPQFLNQKRQKYRNYLLNDSYYQGSSEGVRQRYYESFVMSAMQALKHVQEVNTAKTEKDRNNARKNALTGTKWILGEIKAIDAVID